MRRPALPETVLAAAAVAIAARAAALAAADRVPLGFAYGGRFVLVGLALVASLALTGLALGRAAADLRAGTSRARPFAPLRHAFTAAVLGWLAFVAFVQPFQRLHLDLAAGLVAGGWALAGLIGRRHERGARAPSQSPRLGRVLRLIDLVLFTAGVAALALELGLRVWAAAAPSPLLARVGAAPASVIARFRSAPGTLRFGFPCNSRGDYDDEPGRGAGRLIVALGDSFNVGAVPHALHYTTVLEELTGDTVYNLGVAGIGPPEYAALVALEAAPMRPDAILVALFVGNDLDVADLAAGLPDAGLRSWFDRSQVLLGVLPGRLRKLSQEQARLDERGEGVGGDAGGGGGGGVARVQGESVVPTAGTDAAALAIAFPWIADPALEQPTLGEETFLRLETQRALAVCAGRPAGLDLACRSLLEARRAAGDVPLLVVLVPDEFQVEDDLWEQVSGRAARPLERDRPQSLLTAWLDEQRIPHLDLLPALRAVPPLEDGRRHLYHARDTHWNARGNRVAAEALAEWLPSR